MKAHICALTLHVFSLSVPGAAQAEFFDLPDLVGIAPVYNDDPIVIQFDLGQEFAEVREVLLLLEATVTPLTYQSCGTWSVPEPCELQVVNTGFFARLEDPTGYDTYALVDDFRSDYAQKRAGVFDRSFLEFSFDHLNDGKGTLIVHWNGVLFIPEQIITEFTPPTGVISEAALVVDGIPLPEPSQSAQLSAGLLLLLLLHVGDRWRRHAV